MAPFGRVLVRSDPLTRKSPSVRAGNICELSELDECADRYFLLCRVLLLFEPYARQQNRWSFSLLIDREHKSWDLEIVGAGFDCGHLNQGRVAPHESFAGAMRELSTFEIARHTKFNVDKYRQDSERLKTSRRDGGPLPTLVREHIFSDAARLTPRLPFGLSVLSGAVVSPGDRLTYWDVFDPTQAGR
jgi:hypothetical protein